MYKKLIKPILDRVGAAVFFVALSPLLVLIMLALGLFQQGPVFFIQDRPGLHGQKFRLMKFASMIDVSGQKVITPLGRFLRKTSLDELPQLVNVLRGEMSLVGPRPLLMEYADLYSKEQWRRHQVLPGMTGWAQVNGRTAITWKEKFDFDAFYVEHCSFKLDCLIIMKTIKTLMQRELIQEEKFNGTN